MGPGVCFVSPKGEEGVTETGGRGGLKAGGGGRGGMVKVGLYEIPPFSLHIKARPGNTIQRGNLHFHEFLVTLLVFLLLHPPPTPPCLSAQTPLPTTVRSPIPPTPFASTHTAEHFHPLT